MRDSFPLLPFTTVLADLVTAHQWSFIHAFLKCGIPPSKLFCVMFASFILHGDGGGGGGVTAALTYVGCVSRINSTDKWCTEGRRKRGKKDGEEDLNRWEGRSALRRGDEGIIYMILRWVVGGGMEEWSNTGGAEERKIQGGNNMESPWIGKVTAYSLATVVTISHWEVMLPASDNAT